MDVKNETCGNLSFEEAIKAIFIALPLEGKDEMICIATDVARSFGLSNYSCCSFSSEKEDSK